MTRSILFWHVVLIAGCGRLAFDPLAIGDGGTAGDGGPDSDGGPTACPGFAELCDGFETGDTSKWSGLNVSVGDTLVVDSLNVESGRFALDGTAPAAGGGGASSSVCHDHAAQGSGMLALREWIYSPQPLVNFDSVVSFYTIPSCVDQTSSGDWAAAGCDDVGDWVINENSVVGGEFSYSGSPCVPVDTWICIELDYRFDAPAHVQLYAGDAIVVEHDTADPAPMFDAVFAGLTRADAAGYQVFVDDVVVATQHIGCQ